ncbi:MAG: enoyl-CoA hydratase/isomerase family protein [Proteobacteria bacterium]|nr:enoyl-CoA hydratase/isomerase family protein [Pseudomonadota bacterium]MBU4471021.1 enoyl-CoA hydratase/isomerase family protein [Pseudomonadota bacterium]MCG2753621.1 enoyl-CoA hydratase/isomerase family protein [Desulfobacteraceae bacterium]
MTLNRDEDSPVLISIENSLMTLALNRPKAINSLTIEMIGMMQKALDQAANTPEIQLVFITGKGEKGFCAGADVKAASKAVGQGRKDEAMRFFIEEYALDLTLHRFPKPVVVLAHGITMGGGLGLAAGAGLVLVTETSRMAMPETRIGFFPDVGATGWLFEKCPEGYAEYLALTGQEVQGPECVGLGLAHGLLDSFRIPEATAVLKNLAGKLSPGKEQALQEIRAGLASLLKETPPRESNPEDTRVRDHFYGQTSVLDILQSLSRGETHREWCESVLKQFSERSPTASVLTLWLLRENENRPLEKVFKLETSATRFIISHPDYIEGVRARLVDKDNTPKWHPDTWNGVSLPKLDPEA